MRGWVRGVVSEGDTAISYGTPCMFHIYTPHHPGKTHFTNTYAKNLKPSITKFFPCEDVQVQN